MLYPIKDKEYFKNLNELASLQCQVKEVRLQDKLGNQKYHYEAEKIQAPLADTIKDISEILTKSIKDTYKKNNKALENLKEKVLELMNDKGMIAPYLASSSVNIFKSENKR